MIIAIGSIVAKETRVAEALGLSRVHVARSRLEPGCLQHAVHIDVDNPLRLVFVEHWETQSALWEHFKLPASRNFAKALADTASDVSDLKIYDATPVPLPGRSVT